MTPKCKRCDDTYWDSEAHSQVDVTRVEACRLFPIRLGLPRTAVGSAFFDSIQAETLIVSTSSPLLLQQRTWSDGRGTSKKEFAGISTQH
jgi:hypothetical protein